MDHRICRTNLCLVTQITNGLGIRPYFSGVIPVSAFQPEEMAAVGITRRWRDHRRMVRDNQAMARAIEGATTPAMRSELIALANSQPPHYAR